MDWLQFFSSLIGSLAWPAAVVFIAFLLKGPLSKLIPRVRGLKYGDLHVDIAEQLEEVKEQVTAAGEAQDAEVKDPSIGFRSLAEADPRAAILSAWIPVEVELNELAKKGGVELVPGMSTHKLLIPLEKQGLLNRSLIEKIAKLRHIRNAALHVTEQVLSFEDAMSMAEMCSLLTAQLKLINASA